MISVRGALMKESSFIKIAIEVRAFLLSGENSRNNYHRGTKLLDMLGRMKKPI